MACRITLSRTTLSPSSSSSSAPSFLPPNPLFHVTTLRFRTLRKCFPFEKPLSVSASASSTSNSLRALVFDCDGVILESEHLHRQAYNDAFAYFNVRCPSSSQSQQPLYWDSDFYDDLQNRIGGGKPKMRWYFGENGWPSSTILEKPPEADEDRAKLVDTLQGRKLAVCSAATKSSVILCLESLIGFERFQSLDCFLAGDDVKEKKPDPSIYLTASKRLGISPQNCLVVEDSIIGLQAAKGAGMSCVITYTSSTADQDFKDAIAIYPDLSDVRMAMSTRCSDKGDEAEGIRELVKDIIDVGSKMYLGDVLGPLRKLASWLYGKKAMDVFVRFDRLLERMLKDHEDEGKKREHEDLMDILLKVHKDDKAEVQMTRTHLKALVGDLFVRDTGTASEAILWTIVELINHPHAFNKLREEIKSVVGNNRLVEESDISNLPYLQAVVKEGLRLNPPAPLATRAHHQNCKLEGFDIPRKTMIFINLYTIMRDPNIWENPYEFWSERFLVSSYKEGKENMEETFQFLPFGAGRRACPGSKLGLGRGQLQSWFSALIGRLVEMERLRLIWKLKNVLSNTWPIHLYAFLLFTSIHLLLNHSTCFTTISNTSTAADQDSNDSSPKLPHTTIV